MQLIHRSEINVLNGSNWYLLLLLYDQARSTNKFQILQYRVESTTGCSLPFESVLKILLIIVLVSL